MKDLSPKWFLLLMELEGVVLTVEDGVESYCGINRKWHPDWEGWQYIDVQQLEEAFVFVYPFYQRKWETVKADLLVGVIAGHYFDFAVNSGGRTACRVLQTCLNTRGHGLVVDGLMGPKTAHAVDLEWGKGLEMQYAAARLDYLRSLPNKGNYMRGWLRRVGKVLAY